ncbi:hypothetical protein [Halorubrum salinum]|uniref:hypothetical protein n=1 Tax=Halorubrum salinum TaxID=767517 RepID=UPI0021119FA2|nr:hypothetical protein [Halorubrum salinum]
MFAATEFLASLGFGSQIVVAASLVMVALYVYRAVGVARIVAGVGGMIASHALVLLVTFAAVIALGWVAPNAGTMVDHTQIAWRFATDQGVELARKGWKILSSFGR